MSLLDFISLKDMVDGGGAGASGSTFKGGTLSPLLNTLGIKPMGQAAAQPTSANRPMQRSGNLPALPPTGGFGGQGTLMSIPAMLANAKPMDNDQLIKFLLQALSGNRSDPMVGPR